MSLSPKFMSLSPNERECVVLILIWAYEGEAVHNGRGRAGAGDRGAPNSENGTSDADAFELRSSRATAARAQPSDVLGNRRIELVHLTGSADVAGMSGTSASNARTCGSNFVNDVGPATARGEVASRSSPR